MSHKKNCIEYTKEYLQNLQLEQYFSLAMFESYYKKHNGANNNAWKVGCDVADYIIVNTSMKANEFLS